MSATPTQADVRLTSSEADELLRLLDIAVRAQGLAVAGNALRLVGKIQAAFKSPVE